MSQEGVTHQPDTLDRAGTASALQPECYYHKEVLTAKATASSNGAAAWATTLWLHVLDGARCVRGDGSAVSRTCSTPGTRARRLRAAPGRPGHLLGDAQRDAFSNRPLLLRRRYRKLRHRLEHCESASLEWTCVKALTETDRPFKALCGTFARLSLHYPCSRCPAPVANAWCSKYVAFSRLLGAFLLVQSSSVSDPKMKITRKGI